MTKTLLLAGVASLTFIASQAMAEDASLSIGNEGVCSKHIDHSQNHGHHDHSAVASSPVGLMGDHMHGQGDWMVSYRYMRMAMEGNRIGTDEVSPEEIVTTVANRFFGTPGQPATLRVVPTEMTMDMHMFGAMYGVTDWLTLMGMAMYKDNEMDHITFQGGAGTTRLGTFETESKGWGDLMVSGLIKAYDDQMHRVHFNLGLSIPTGSIKEEDTILTPMNTTPRVRLPYAMQLGTGTYDIHPGVTYTGHQDSWSWGAQYKAEIRLEDENNQGYSWGDKHGLNLWGGYQWTKNVGTSLRVSAMTQDEIDGIDPNIVLPVQTADPENYGGEIVEASVGLNLKGTEGWTSGHEIGFEVGLPLYQDLNGPQMERDYQFTLGWKTSF